MNISNKFDNSNEQVDEISLSALKAAIKTIVKTTPENTELKKDLKYIVETIEGADDTQLVECNKKICRKYPEMSCIAINYNLIMLKEGELENKSLYYKIQSLHQIGHYIEDRIKGNIATQFVKEVAKEGIECGIRKISEQ